MTFFGGVSCGCSCISVVAAMCCAIALLQMVARGVSAGCVADGASGGVHVVNGDCDAATLTMARAIATGWLCGLAHVNVWLHVLSSG